MLWLHRTLVFTLFLSKIIVISAAFSPFAFAHNPCEKIMQNTTKRSWWSRISLNAFTLAQEHPKILNTTSEDKENILRSTALRLLDQAQGPLNLGLPAEELTSPQILSQIIADLKRGDLTSLREERIRAIRRTRLLFKMLGPMRQVKAEILQRISSQKSNTPNFIDWSKEPPAQSNAEILERLKYTMEQSMLLLLHAGLTKDDAWTVTRRRIFRAAINNFTQSVPEAYFDAFLNSLDSYSDLINPDTAHTQLKAQDSSLINKPLGITMTETSHGYHVLHVDPGSDAEKAGLQERDVILEVDGLKFDHEHAEAFQNAIGAGREPIKRFKVQRQSIDSALDIVIARTQVPAPQSLTSKTLTTSSNRMVAWLTYKQFSDKSGEKFRKTLYELIERDPIQALVIDLRDNRGGYVPELIVILRSLGISQGAPLFQIGTPEKIRSEYYQNDEVNLRIASLPIVILVNDLSTSCSEALALTMQEHGRGIIVGTPTTFGKGITQSAYNNPELGNSFKFTTGWFSGPSGASPQITGVRSDIVLMNPQAEFNMSKIPNSLGAQVLPAMNSSFLLRGQTKKHQKLVRHLRERSTQRYKTASSTPETIPNEVLNILDDWILYDQRR